MNGPAVRVALVTGASRGIGAGIARLLAARNLRVIGTATTDAGAARIDQALGPSVVGRRLDIGDPEDVDRFFAGISDGPGMPLVLVNNAGITRDNLMLRMTPEQWSEVIDTNLSGLYRITRPVLRGMLRARWGRVVNVSSVVARSGNPGQTNYAASKAGVEGFTRSLAQEVASRGITVNAVAPGYIATDMTAQLTDSQADDLLGRIPLGRMGTASDVAEAVAFLVSDAAGYITGETLHVNGGLHVA
ncbi:MAG: 3-oxoacyl-[acyl-carrier-protein] reductase [Gammaproteobacteria bacterium]|nr:3-oxoacyl-[acyl-carrier-protein] reductase [Gammaproteobacteria bacterium]MDE0368271.1 3-oxoacyl-[acyl-carrier-protein] reductase [Gammaproteobacteria bacterium]